MTARCLIKIGLSVVALATVACWGAYGQVASSVASTARPQFLFISSSSQAQGAALPEVVRVIDDPHTGDRWLLIRDRKNPAGPGRLVLTGLRNEAQQDWAVSESLGATSMLRRPVIHTGDRLIVEENTTFIEAHLEAVALGPASIGSPFNARLKIGGKVARVVALAPGRAAFAAEVWP
jgi:hypothetical protein